MKILSSRHMLVSSSLIALAVSFLFGGRDSFSSDAQTDYPVAGQLDDVATSSATENQTDKVRITAKRALHTNLRDNAGSEVGTSGNPLRTDPTGTTSQPVTQVTSPWVTSRNWTLSSGTDSIAAVQSGTWTAGRTWTLASGIDSVTSVVSDVSPANGSITALDVGTASLSGANSQVFYFGTPTTNSSANFTLSSIENVSVQANILGSGGTLVVEVSTDGGSFWFRPNVYQVSTQSYSNAFTAPFQAIVNVAGMSNLRVRSTSSWSGSATIIVKESLNARSVTIADALPPGTNAIGSVAQSGTWTTGRTWTLSSGTDSIAAIQSGTWNITNISGTVSLPTGASTSSNQTSEITALQIIDDIPTAVNGAFVKGVAAMGQLDDTSTTAATEDNVAPIRITAQRAEHVNLRNAAGTEIGTASNPVRTDPTGTTAQVVTQIDGPRTTYWAAVANVAVGALATDIFTITGSGTKTVRVLKIEISGTETTGAVRDFDLIKRSAANTGGTSTTMTNVPVDSTDAAGTATVRAYTVNPTVLGASLGLVRTAAFEIPATNLAGESGLVEWDFAQHPGEKGIVLRGTAEVLAVNFEGVTAAGAAINYSILWTEE